MFCPPICCKPNCCCKCCCPPRPIFFGAASYFHESQPNFSRLILPGQLDPTPDSDGEPVVDVLVPLNLFNPLAGFSKGENALVTSTAGLYELRYTIAAQFIPPFPYEVYVAKTVNGAGSSIKETVQAVNEGILPLAAEEPIEPADSFLDLLPILPQYLRMTAKTAKKIQLPANAQLRLFLRMKGPGLLRVLPGAMLSAQHIS